jgi:hypothetical protein
MSDLLVMAVIGSSLEITNFNIIINEKASSITGLAFFMKSLICYLCLNISHERKIVFR